MPTILITGSSGFIGGVTHARFQSMGWETIGIGRRKSDQDSYVRFDLSTALDDSIRDAIASADVVLHAAARSSPWGSRKQFESANVVATRNLLEACNRSSKPKFIFVSSSSVYYRAADQLGINESTPQAEPAVNLYAETKQRAEELVRGYAGEWVILRPRAVYGTGDMVLFPRILAAAKAGKLPLLIREGKPAVGDLIAIENLVDCFVRAASDDQVRGEYNLTDNDPQEIIAFLLSVFDKLGIEKPQKQISVKTAMRAAWMLEHVFRLAMPWREPPITRFGVHVFAYSKTFDVSKMLEVFGPPKRNTQQSVDEFVSWVNNENPYGLQ